MDASGSGASIFCIFGAVQTGGFTLSKFFKKPLKNVLTFQSWVCYNMKYL